MPLRNEPHSLERCAMLCILHHFDYICYGCTTRKQMHRMLEDESFLQIDGPFVSLPSTVLSKMLTVMLDGNGHIQRQHLHVLMQNNLDELKLDRNNAYMGIEMLRTGRCQKLRRLDLSYIRVIRPHILLDLLSGFAHLSSLNLTYTETVDHVFEVLDSSTWQADGCPPGYQLLALTSEAEHVTSFSVDLACALCPRAQTVTLNNALASSEILYKFMALDHLAHLQLTNTDGMVLDFLDGVVPLLTVKGHQLLSLLLSNFAFVDVGAIGECCPRLRNLALSEVLLYDELGLARENLFTELRALELWADPSPTSTLTSVVLQQLLTYCSDLQNLLLRGIVALNDKLFLQILEQNPMKRLSRITLDGCPNMSALTLHALLSSTNELTLIRVWSCFLVGNEHHEELQRRVVEENCNMNLDWFAWEG
ncbi:uncharacterized protein LOC143039963 isoform X4 [Oratosquilla oratoria]|uniref:uncharacterized protein LOC143039963 isoform X4 n=1 Tax=Oratosquilla oratoria TaxID=337810 RepID=UPI003F761873